MTRNFAQETVALLCNDSERMACLRTAQELHLPDWYIVAGFVRNLIWDRVVDVGPRTNLADVDVAFYDPEDLSVEAELDITRRLSERLPHARWEVKNQARMHFRNRHPQYQSTLDAISYYPELQTCVGVRLEPNDEILLAAPFGLSHNWDGTVAINRKAGYSPVVAAERVLKKRWLEIWPLLRLQGDDLNLAIDLDAQVSKSIGTLDGSFRKS